MGAPRGPRQLKESLYARYSAQRRRVETLPGRRVAGVQLGRIEREAEIARLVGVRDDEDLERRHAARVDLKSCCTLIAQP